MGKKHKQRTRAAKLARRELDGRFTTGRSGLLKRSITVKIFYGPEVDRAQRGKYRPHFGKKQISKLAGALREAA